MPARAGVVELGLGSLPEREREAFQPVSPDMLELGVERFWDQHR